MHSLLSPEKRDGHQVRRASVLFGLYFPYFFLAWLPQCGRVPSRPVNPYSWASAQAMPRATDRSQPPTLDVCLAAVRIGTALASALWVLSSLVVMLRTTVREWGSRFASSEATKENQNEDNASYRYVVASSTDCRVQREPSASRNGRTSGTSGTGRPSGTDRQNRPIRAAGGPRAVRATGRDGSAGSDRRSGRNGRARAAGPER